MRRAVTSISSCSLHEWNSFVVPLVRWLATLRNLLALSLAAMFCAQPLLTQEGRSDLARLLRLDGLSGTEVRVTITVKGPPSAPLVALRDARIDAEGMGFLARYRSSLTVVNHDPGRTVAGLEWRLDVYDEDYRILSRSLLLDGEVKISPGASGTASVRFGATLPDRMVVLAQLARVTFSDDSTWTPLAQCRLGDDLKSVTCEFSNRR